MEKRVFDKINPFVRYAQSLRIYPSSSFQDQTAYDHRIMYMLSGTGVIEIDGKEYKTEEGDLLIWRSGLRYSLCSPAEEKIKYLQVNFDLFPDAKHLKTPIVPAKNAKKDFKPIENIDLHELPEFSSPLYIKNAVFAEGILREVIEEYRRQRILCEEVLSGLARTLIFKALRHQNSLSNPKASTTEEILTYIDQHYTEDISNTTVAGAFGYHPNYIGRLVIAETGISLHRYVLKRRIQRAEELLMSTDLQANEIATRVGFNSYEHFLKYFKKLTGKNTKDFR